MTGDHAWQLHCHPAVAGWPPLSTLASAGALAGVVGRVAARLGGCEPRVAASALQLGTAAQLWSLSLTAVAERGTALEVDALRWSEDGGSLSLGAWPGAAEAPVERLGAEVLGFLARLDTAVTALARVPPQLLWGNAAAALAGARQVAWDAVAREVADTLLDSEPLRGHVAAGRRTRTCCLFYRAGGLCGDCVFDAPPGR